MIQSRQYHEFANKVVIDEMHPLIFFREAVALFGAKLGEKGLKTGSIKATDEWTIVISGPKPKRFDDVCLANWEEIGTAGWSQVMKSNLKFRWDEGAGDRYPSMIPGLAIAIELVAFECESEKANILTLHSRRTIETALRIDPKAPYRTACQLVEREWTWFGPELGEGYPTLHRVGGEYFEWTGTHYKSKADASIRADLYHCLAEAVSSDEGALFHPDQTKVSKVEDALRAIRHHDGDSGIDFWFDDVDAKLNLISVENGLLNPVNKSIQPHNPKFFNRNSIPVWFEEIRRGEPVEWLKFLDSVWPGDQESIRLLQQWMGYFVTNRTELHKIMLLIGPPRSGKGTIAGVLTKLLGSANVAGPTLADFSSQFGMGQLISKKVAIVGDARFAGRQDQMALVLSRMLAISGGDTLTIDRKYMHPWIGKLAVRLLICSNELPRLSDASGALASRFSTLQMRRSYLGSEDFLLADRLNDELPKILSWALDGLDDLDREGRFIEAVASFDAKNDFAAISSPIANFVGENCNIKVGASIPSEALYARWRLWCEANGRAHSGTHQVFGRDLKAAFPGICTSQIRAGNLRGKREYIGIELRG